MLCKLSLKNIKKSFKNYAIYFFTLILGVSIFYVFNALDSQTIMMNVSASTREIIKLMNDVLSVVSVFVSFVLGFLIIYASRFLMRRRNQEFGIYLTLGMGKRKISMILFLETLFIGTISLIVGLGLGVLLSQLMSILVANMFEADLKQFTFVFSYAACFKTMIYFGIMYLFVMIFNTFSISKCKLIDLLHGSKKSEQIKMKNPIVCTIVFLITSLVLGYAYYLVTGGVENLLSAESIFLPIILGIVCTFFLFWSLSGLLIKIVTSRKKVYYKGLNSFVIRQVSSKINTTVFSMGIICLMLFVTICVLSSALSIKNSLTYNLIHYAPIDITFQKRINLTEEEASSSWRYHVDMVEDSNLSLEETLKNLSFDVTTNLKDTVMFTTYQNSALTVKDTLGTYYEEAKEKYPFLRYDMEEEIIKLSDYNQAAKLLGTKEYILDEDEYVIVADYDGWIATRNEGLKRGTKITIGDREYSPKYDTCQDGFLVITANKSNMGVIVVPDSAVEDLSGKQEYLLANYNKEEKEEKERIEDLISAMDKNEYMKKTPLSIYTKISLYEASVGLGAMVTFIGLYLGIIFLISSAAILALKELSESSDNKERYDMLRKIGVDEKMIHMALFKQIAIFFLFPLLIAIIHSIFGIMFCNYVLTTFGNEKLLSSILLTTIFLIVIYGGYFAITYGCSKSMIKEKM